MPIDPGAQVKAARILLKLSQEEVAALAGCHRHTVREVEGGIMAPVRERIVKALQDKGIVFLRDGLRLRSIQP